jgi:hypothetical protein
MTGVAPLSDHLNIVNEVSKTLDLNAGQAFVMAMTSRPELWGGDKL